MELDFLLKIETLKREMSYLAQYNIKNLFLAITEKEFIDETILRRFLKKLGH